MSSSEDRDWSGREGRGGQVEDKWDEGVEGRYATDRPKRLEKEEWSGQEYEQIAAKP